MTFINYASREINCKIVYYGPGLCGKTTNLQHIYDSTAPQAKGKLISLATETDRTLFFDFMPLELGTVRGFKTRFHLYTVPGQVYYDASRKLILKGVDGVVFVADSQEERMDANLESLYNLEENLQTQGYNLMDIPYVLQTAILPGWIRLLFRLWRLVMSLRRRVWRSSSAKMYFRRSSTKASAKAFLSA